MEPPSHGTGGFGEPRVAHDWGHGTVFPAAGPAARWREESLILAEFDPVCSPSQAHGYLPPKVPSPCSFRALG